MASSKDLLRAILRRNAAYREDLTVEQRLGLKITHIVQEYRGDGPVSLDEIGFLCGFDAAEAMAALEQNGWVRKTSGGYAIIASSYP